MDRLRDHLEGYAGDYTLIGGIACQLVLREAGVVGRATKDVDMVLGVDGEADPAFAAHLSSFVVTHGYVVHQSGSGARNYFRFLNPESKDVPEMIELFSRRPLDLDLRQGQAAVPIEVEADAASLSAILMDGPYHELVQEHRAVKGGLSIATPNALIPLKCRAWLDLTARREAGDDSVDKKDIRKHRNDVFILGATLPAATCPLAQSIGEDMREFLGHFLADSGDWGAIRASAKAQGVPLPRAADLLQSIREYFQL